jgi:ubiquinone/menaquinone biosynthesis C-methylase UbiE
MRTMDKPMSNISFRIMSAMLRWFKRESFMRRRLVFTGIKRGDVVLDFGSGPGYFSAMAAEIVGPEGKVYAADIHPMAHKYISDLCRKRGLENVEPMITDCDVPLGDGSVDVVLMFDIIHMLEDPGPVLAEMRRAIKDDGTLSADIYHISVDQAIDLVEKSGFRKKGQLDNTINFSKSL